MIDSYFHVWTADGSTSEKRTERADQLREEMEARGVDTLRLIGAVAEFRRAVEDDGPIGLKLNHHFMPTPVDISDPQFFDVRA